jgi:hypothetical protein
MYPGPSGYRCTAIPGHLHRSRDGSRTVALEDPQGPANLTAARIARFPLWGHRPFLAAVTRLIG